MSRIIAALVAAVAVGGVAVSPAIAEPAPPAPRDLIAQATLEVDDSDLAQEETLRELMDDEIQAKEQSVAAAVGLSFIPGGGWGLLYAGKKPHSAVPFILSIAGYTVGGLYMAGLFDESARDVCLHVRAGEVPIEECGFAETPVKNNEIDPRDNDIPMQPYFRTAGDYNLATVGDDFDGTDVGLIIIASTYAATTLIGAAWAGASVADYNEQVRKDVESTVQNLRTLPRPTVAVRRDGGLFGLALDF